MYDFEEIAKKIEEGGKSLKEQLDEQKKAITNADIPEESKAFLMNTARDIEKGIATGSMDSLLNLMKNYDPNSK
jgi:hypothetical protein